jgi:hypothetical protein
LTTIQGFEGVIGFKVQEHKCQLSDLLFNFQQEQLFDFYTWKKDCNELFAFDAFSISLAFNC